MSASSGTPIDRFDLRRRAVIPKIELLEARKVTVVLGPG
jgi:hypothetical protein